MPIYAYKCASCGFAKDVLQKMSEAPLTMCPSCGEPAFSKQLTAAGFQLKGSGWYVTDFKGGKAAPGSAQKDDAGKPGDGADASSGKSSGDGDAKPVESKDAGSSNEKAEGGKPDAKPAPAPSPSPASSPPAPKPTAKPPASGGG